MNCLSEERKFTNYQTFSPGVVGNIGCPITTTLLKKTDPEGDLRYAESDNNVRAGTYVQDGSSINYAGYGHGGAREQPYRKRICNGFRYQDLREPETSVIPRLNAIPMYNWKSHIAVNEAALTRGLRYEIPGGYMPENISQPRGGLYPRLVQRYEGEKYATYDESYTGDVNVRLPKDVLLGKTKS